MTENECAEPSVHKSGWKSCLRIGLLICLTIAAMELIAWLGGHTDQHEWAVGWLRRYERFSPWLFCLLIALEGFAVSIALSIAHARIQKMARARIQKAAKAPKEQTAAKAPKEKERFEGMSPARVAFRALLYAPVVETLLCQGAFIFILKEQGQGMGTQVAVSAFLFALIHFTESIGVGIAAGIPGGLYFGFTFAFWLQDSFWTAFWVTAVSHFLHNLLPIAVHIWRIYVQKKTGGDQKPPADAS